MSFLGECYDSLGKIYNLLLKEKLFADLQVQVEKIRDTVPNEYKNLIPKLLWKLHRTNYIPLQLRDSQLVQNIKYLFQHIKGIYSNK